MYENAFHYHKLCDNEKKYILKNADKVKTNTYRSKQIRIRFELLTLE